MERRATPQLVLLLVLLFAVLSTLVASNHHFQGRSLVVHARVERIVRNIERIRLYDEILTGSARLAAATGDAAHERRYHQAAAKLDAVIADTLGLAHSTEAEAAVASTSDANQALIAIEERSFVLGRAGRRSAARSLLDSPRYRQQKQVYAQGLERAEAAFRSVVRNDTAQVRRYRPLALGIGILGGAVLLVAGVVILRLARERERLGLEHVAHTRQEADRRATEVEHFETQHTFTDILQVTRQESEANTLIKRHLEQTIAGAYVTVTNRNNSDNRLELMTELPAESPLPLTGFEATAYRIATDEFGTQLDPPAHWAPEYPGIDELPPTYAVCPLVVISIAKQVRKDPRYALTVADVQRFERWHGRIPKGSVVMVSCPCRAARGHGTGSDAGGYARYVAICPPGTANGTQISQRDAPLPTSDSLLHWDESLGYRVR